MGLSRSIAVIPSGVPVGGIGRDFAASLETYFGQAPLHTMTVIEEGTYDDFKACAFRVCSMMAFKVTMDALATDLFNEGLRVTGTNSDHRQWSYCHIDSWRGMVTAVEMSMELVTTQRPEIRAIFDSLGAHYGFIYDRLEVTHGSRSRPIMIGYERIGDLPRAWEPPKVSARFLFKNWS